MLYKFWYNWQVEPRKPLGREIVYFKAASKALSAFPEDVGVDFATELELFRQHRQTKNTFRMQGELRDVYEIKESDRHGTYRVMFTAIIDEKLYVLHAFQKKSKSGIATPTAELDVIRKRLQEVKKIHATTKK